MICMTCLNSDVGFSWLLQQQHLMVFLLKMHSELERHCIQQLLVILGIWFKGLKWSEPNLTETAYSISRYWFNIWARGGLGVWENSYRAVRRDELGLHQQRPGQHATPFTLKNRSRRGRGIESEGSRDELQAEASMLHWRCSGRRRGMAAGEGG